jgi:hypothetical protein
MRHICRHYSYYPPHRANVILHLISLRSHLLRLWQPIWWCHGSNSPRKYPFAPGWSEAMWPKFLLNEIKDMLESGIEPGTLQSRIQCLNHSTTVPHKQFINYHEHLTNYIKLNSVCSCCYYYIWCYFHRHS